MATIRTSVEGARGCGYRKGGGLYLVSGELSEPCPLLPVEMTVCPCCGEGIRPARGWTWVDGGKLIPPQLHGSDEHNAVCPLSPANASLEEQTENPVSRLGDRCGLIWIGETHYKTAREFMDEAGRMGVSRRITKVPRGFKPGETWVLLGHRKAILSGYEADDGTKYTVEEYTALSTPYQHEDEPKPIYSPGIVTAFRPTAIEYIVKGDETDEDLDALEARGIDLVKVVRAEQTEIEEEA